MDFYKLSSDGIYRNTIAVKHREDEYDSIGFNTLLKMQEKHFWYIGRHHFLLSAVDQYAQLKAKPLSAVDLGGGVGGWMRYLVNHRADCLSTIALADSSETALVMAKKVLPYKVLRYHIDLMNLGFEDKWDIAFMLDVIEHLPDDVEAVRQAAKSLKSGGFLFITTPALNQFWSYNDDLAHHLRRYNRSDLNTLAKKTGLLLCDSRYFMFFLSPLYILSRINFGFKNLSDDEKKLLVIKQHQIPPKLFNTILSKIFCFETPLGLLFRFPFGTSILGVFRKL